MAALVRLQAGTPERAPSGSLPAGQAQRRVGNTQRSKGALGVRRPACNSWLFIRASMHTCKARAVRSRMRQWGTQAAAAEGDHCNPEAEPPSTLQLLFPAQLSCCCQAVVTGALKCRAADSGQRRAMQVAKGVDGRARQRRAPGVTLLLRPRADVNSLAAACSLRTGGLCGADGHAVHHALLLDLLARLLHQHQQLADGAAPRVERLAGAPAGQESRAEATGASAREFQHVQQWQRLSVVGEADAAG